ncbi:phosphoenolpyruvate carboxykinase (ATP) [Sinomicrobium pectinilyticum]|uniref:Phosphoenolpyruvate carboxykinase (ATP) n=1 Tax=Sinomicrobium pectinilyticum TaxID=1084421 RepID=A0A3N0E2D9_SINP1|nr:phosphoenolpyruvate carboxykinase (ATP) [Sinomicrobium pectinilyticum]RNL81970.1 phosphoenolpyruvate carboxykinase (ATP) [Sinomicrobium pectinilyticum]
MRRTRFSTEEKNFPKVKQAHWNLPVAELVERSLQNGEGRLTDTGALMCTTGGFTGRSPKDRYIVKGKVTENKVWWGDINIPYTADKFDLLHQKMLQYLEDKEVYVRDVYAGADTRYRMNVRVINTVIWHNMFCHNMFIQPGQEELETFEPEFTILCCPEFKADPETDGTRQENFSIINFGKKIILIGGTGYSGEMKKGIFSVLNFLLPVQHGVLPMHCSANTGMGPEDTAIFFGLSGTGKTTLSADPKRNLIGDDEHGWSTDNVFNFEGGCYAKTIGLTEEKEPDIFNAVKFGAILENTAFFSDSRKVDYDNISITENTRVSYPITHIKNVRVPSKGTIPKNIFFLTCDAFGVIPPIQKLSKSQAMYHFISGYTSKVAGTEEGITEPTPAFSACFGAPFMPLHPAEYAKLLGEKMEKHQTRVWLVNTGWTGGPYGVGSRIKLKYTRAMIDAALSGDLDKVNYRVHSVFNSLIPESCPGVPDKVLSPRQTWNDDTAFYKMADKLVGKFHENFRLFESIAGAEIRDGAPRLRNAHP